MSARSRKRKSTTEQTHEDSLEIENSAHDYDNGWWMYISYFNPKEWMCFTYRCICDVWNTNRRLKIKIRELMEENIRLRVEKNDAITRLSQLVSVHLRDNNPNIVDLNDPYRPTKLAEMFSELYDNEWTAAFLELEEEKYKDRHIVDILLQVLMVSYAFCADILEDNWETVSQWYLYEHAVTAKQTTKALKDGRKVIIPNHVGNVQKRFGEHLLKICQHEHLKQLLERDAVKSYIAKCVQLTLLMNATDPPVVMECPGWNDKKGIATDDAPEGNQSGHGTTKLDGTDDYESMETDEDKDTVSTTPKRMAMRKLYNKEMFKEYTTRGQYYEFGVWPVLFLHKNGPILGKGIAQGVNDPNVKDIGQAKSWFG